MPPALKSSFIFGSVWEHQASFSVALYPKYGTVQAHSTIWAELWLFAHFPWPSHNGPRRLSARWVVLHIAATQAQIFSLAASSLASPDLETAVTDKPKGAVHHCFLRGCAPRATSGSNFCLPFIHSKVGESKPLHFLCLLIFSSAFIRSKTLQKMTASSVLSLK